MDSTDENIKNVQARLQTYMKRLRADARSKCCECKNSDEIIGCEERTYYEGETAKKRVVVFLRGAGCRRVESSGGCTFCGFYNATKKGNKISGERYLAQIQKLLDEWSQKVTKVCYYNDGSMLSDDEIDFDTVLEIFKLTNKTKNIEEITIESDVEDITDDKLKALTECFDGKIEIAVGFESADPLIRDICINKSFENSKFENDVAIAKKYNIDIIPSIMVKPPFLTEREATNDVVNSMIYLEQFHLKRIDLELPTIQYNTLTFVLWAMDKYLPMNMWTLVELARIKKSKHLTTRIYVSSMKHTVNTYDSAFSCYICYKDFAEAAKKYNQTQDPSVFDHISCECKKRWEFYYKAIWDRPIIDRVDKFLKFNNL